MPFHTDTHPDVEVEALIKQEFERQTTGLQLIASENFTSPAVMRAVGSVLTNKYSEGYRSSGSRPCSVPTMPTCSRTRGPTPTCACTKRC
jgi:hypothetical protein